MYREVHFYTQLTWICFLTKHITHKETQNNLFVQLLDIKNITYDHGRDKYGGGKKVWCRNEQTTGKGMCQPKLPGICLFIHLARFREGV